MDLYYKIKTIREDLIAPVDVIGCYSVPNSVEDKKLYVLISLIISAQTKDEINYQTMLNICTNQENKKYTVKYQIIENYLYLYIDKKCYKYTKKSGKIFGPEINLEVDNLTVKNLLNETNLLQMLKPVGLYNKKYNTIKNLLKFIESKGYPSSLTECLSIKGIGIKMSYLYLNMFYNTVGISVDTHVHRLSNMFNIVNTKTPEETSKQLENIIDKKEWKMFNNVLVGYGQVICKSRSPNCYDCKIYKECTSSKKIQF